MSKIRVSLLRGICQTPAYIAHDMGYFKAEGVDVEVEIAATAWLVPHKLASGECHFAVMPWTRVAAAEDHSLLLLAGSGCEEAAIVMRHGIDQDAVRKVAVPLRGGIKDLTAMGLIKSLGWENVDILRTPSGDGAIIAFFGQGVDAASMVEPYATMMELLGVGKVIRRTGDIWQGAPGCSLSTTKALRQREPEVVAKVVRAFARGEAFVRDNPEQSAEIAARYIGVNQRFIREALNANRPNIRALDNDLVMADILRLMQHLGYVSAIPSGFMDLSFLKESAAHVHKEHHVSAFHCIESPSR